MTATIFSSSTLNNGMREFGQVTNTFGGYLQSAGATPYNLQLPFQADVFQYWRDTSYGSGGTVSQGIWFRDFAAAHVLNITSTPALIRQTTLGITIANVESSFTDQHLVINDITPATPGVVTTTTNHGLSDNDRVYITQVVGTLGPSVNNMEFVIRVTAANKFGLYDVYGAPYTTSGTYTSGGQVTIEGPSLNIQKSPKLYYLTLGTNVMGSDNDIIYFIATQFNSYQNIGDVA